MKFSISTKLVLGLLVILFVLPFISHGSEGKERGSRVEVKEEKNRLKVTLKKRTFYDPIDIKETRNIFIPKLNLQPGMDLQDANQQVKKFRNKVTTLGVNLNVFKKIKKESKEKITQFLTEQLPELINLRVSLKKILDFGGKMRILSLGGIPFSKAKAKNFATIAFFMRTKYLPARKLAERITKTGTLISEIIDDLEEIGKPKIDIEII